MGTLAVVIGSLLICPRSCRRRACSPKSVTYGVKAEHYAPVGAALLWTLERGLGPAWTPPTAAAWTSAYGTLSNFMIAEAYGGAAA